MSKTIVEDWTVEEEIRTKIFADFLDFADRISRKKESEYYYTPIGRIDFVVYSDQIDVKVNGTSEIRFSKDLTKHNLTFSKSQLNALHYANAIANYPENTEAWRKDKVKNITNHIWYIVNCLEENGCVSDLTFIAQNNFRTELTPDYHECIMFKKMPKFGISTKYKKIIRFGAANKYGFIQINPEACSEKELLLWESLLNQVAKTCQK